ncbi:MAG: beta galactosidase jelly roll domain-containing protein [Phycisphaeraceae bacterium]|nr:beta galactosidase jelly roll domain-containing protein [Phycisphaeraceae bacterium]
MTRTQVDLTGPWKFLPDPATEGMALVYFRPGHDDTSWAMVQLPCALDDCLPGLAGFEGPAWFRRTVNIPEAWRGQHVLIRFEGVNHHTQVFVNGGLVGSHADGYLRFEFPIHEHLQYGRENTIAVLVDGLRRPGEAPGMERGWRHYAGIVREMSLLVLPPVHLADVHVRAQPQGEGGQLSLLATFSRPKTTPPGSYSLAVDVLTPKGEKIARVAETVPDPGGGGTLTLNAQVPHVTAWSPDTPALYTAEVSLLQGKKIIDALTVPFGFRRIEARGRQILLNGQPIYLCGYNRHEDSPRTGMGPDPQTVRQDLLTIKKSGCNFVRLCHYPHHPLELDLCDQLGLLVMAEIPLYWWRGLQEGKNECAAKFAAAQRQLEKLIHRDRNHPSVMFWSVSNETEDFRPEVAEGNAQLVRLAKSLDPSRLAVHVTNHWQTYPRFAADDVLCVNDYPSLGGRSSGTTRPYDYALATHTWRRNLAQLHQLYPDKPIFITEFGHPSLEGVRAGLWGVDSAAEALKAEFAGMDAPCVCGALIWCWADHPWPESYLPPAQNLHVSPYGVVTRDRRSKGSLPGLVSSLFQTRRHS